MTDRYRPTEHYLVRIPRLPISAHAHAVAGDALEGPMARLLKDDDVRATIELAAPGLREPISRWLDRGIPPNASEARAFRRYLARMSSRATPFGFFAGVGVRRFADGSDDQSAADSFTSSIVHGRARLDMGALLEQVRVVESRVAGDRTVPLVWNVLASRSGDRLELPVGDVVRDGSVRMARIRLTRPLEAVRGRTKHEALSQDDLEELLDPRRKDPRVGPFVAKLRELRFLLPDLRPALLGDRPDLDLLQRLQPYLTEGELRWWGQLAELTREPWPYASDLAAALQKVNPPRESGDAERSEFGDLLAVDAVATPTGTALPPTVGEALADAATFLSKVCRAAGDGALGVEQPLADYHQTFLELYGLGTALPIQEVLSDDGGLGLPMHFDGKDNGQRARTLGLNDYERVLLDALSEVWSSGSHILHIDDELEKRMLSSLPEMGPRRPRRSLDMFAQVAADSEEALVEGHWTAVLNKHAVSRGGSSYGRFLHLFNDGTRAELTAPPPSPAPDVEIVEVTYLPKLTRGANVAIRPGGNTRELPINCGPSVAIENRTDLDELYVWADYDHLRLWSSRWDREVLVTENHLLTPEAAPHPSRLAIEISERQFEPLGGFSWGPFEESFHLPRVQRGNVVLRVAEWTLLRKDFTSVVDDPARFAEALASHRVRWAVPRFVYSAEVDQRLLLDLDTEAGIEDLRLLLRGGRVTLQEMYPDAESLWMKDRTGAGYLPEIVVPLRREGGASHGLADVALRPQLARSPSALADDRWLYLRLYGPVTAEEHLISTHIAQLIGSMPPEQSLHWFFIRYLDPAPHVRLRIRTDGDGTLRDRCLAWAEHLRRADVLNRVEVGEYRPETARYGGPDCIVAAERYFCAASRTVAACFGLLDRLPREVVGVALIHHLRAAWECDDDGRLNHDSERKSRLAKGLFRRHRDQFIAAVAEIDGAVPAGELSTAIRTQDESLQAFVRAVRKTARTGSLTMSEHAVAESCIHMVANRLLGTDREEEIDVNVLWSLSERAWRGMERVGRSPQGPVV